MGLDSFKNLSDQEQSNLITYMKKLENTNPEKVKKLKEGMRKGKDSSVKEGSQNKASNSDRDWSPINKRSRRLSGSDLDMNPSAPDPDVVCLNPENPKKTEASGWEDEDVDNSYLYQERNEFTGNVDSFRRDNLDGTNISLDNNVSGTSNAGAFANPFNASRPPVASFGNPGPMRNNGPGNWQCHNQNMFTDIRGNGNSGYQMFGREGGRQSDGHTNNRW